MRREDRAEQQHVQLALVVADEDGRARREVRGAGDDGEAHARREPHAPFEGPRDRVLRAAVVVGEAEEERREDAVEGAQEEAEVRG